MIFGPITSPRCSTISGSPGPIFEVARPKGSLQRLQHTLSTLRTALDWAVRQRLLGYNHARDVDRPQREHTEMRVWTAAELGTLMVFIGGKRFHPLLRLAAFTGMRRSELLGLKWRDVDLDGAILRVRRVRYKVGYEMLEEERTKSKAGRRVVDLDPTTVNVLRQWERTQQVERESWGIAYHDSGMVFTAEDGQPYHADRVAQAFERFVSAAPVPRIRFHDLRHTHASLLVAQRVLLVDVAYRLGDCPKRSCRHTAHFIPGQGQAMASAFSEMVDGRRRDRDASQ